MTESTNPVAQHLRVHALFRMPELVGTVPGLAGTTVATGITRVERGSAQTVAQDYYDTADLRLIRGGAMLTRRAGGSEAGWHLSLPPVGDPGAADEVHRPLSAGRPGRVPAELTDAVTALARRAPVVRVAQLTIERSVHVLFDDADEPVAELVDEVVSIMDGKVVAGRFREITLSSVADHDQGVLAPVLDLLAAHGAVPGGMSRTRSVLGPAAEGSPEVPEPDRVGPDDPAGEAVHAHLVTHVRRFLLQDARVRQDLPDSVHQMRVAARRLRSGLRVFGPLVETDWSRHLRDELGWAASELGLSRDSEVLLARLDAHADELCATDAALIHEHIDPMMTAKVAAGRAEALAALRSERHLALLDALVDAANNPRLTPAAQAPAREALPPLFDKAWRKLAKEVKALTLHGPADEWHETRITAKRARYAAEALAPVFGASAKGLASALGEVTEQLGEHQDAYIAQEACRELAEHFEGPTGFALGLLSAYQVECELIARVKMTEKWPGVRRQRAQTSLG
ncbi:MAG: CYTH and CHAD domain-containing protein [Candidatus Nanopelagicales bacterium]